MKRMVIHMGVGATWLRDTERAGLAFGNSSTRSLVEKIL